MWDKTQYECTLCCCILNKTRRESRGKLEIGRNLDNEKEDIILCPACNGTGWIEVERKWGWGKPHHRMLW